MNGPQGKQEIPWKTAAASVAMERQEFTSGVGTATQFHPFPHLWDVPTVWRFSSENAPQKFSQGTSQPPPWIIFPSLLPEGWQEESRRRRRSCAPWNGGIISMWLWVRFNSLLTQTSSTRNNRFPGIFLVPFPWLSSHPVGHPGWILGCFHFSSSVLVE